MLREEMSTAMAKAKEPTNGKDKGDTIIYNLMEELGSTGTKIFSGIMNEEYLAEWRTLEPRCKIIDRMLRSDASIRAIYLAMTLPIESAEWKIHFDGEMSEEDKFIKDYLEKMLFKDMTITWQSFIRQALSFLPYGFCVKEGSNVVMADGTPRKIEDIVVGDKVIGGAGDSVSVKHTFKRETTETMYKIKCMGVASEIEVTGNHIVVTAEGEKKVKDLKVGDTLIQPKVKLTLGGDYNSGWLLGLYLAEGHKDKNRNRVVFTLHKKELNLVESRLKEWLEKYTITFDDVKTLTQREIASWLHCNNVTAAKIQNGKKVGRDRQPRIWLDDVSEGGRVSLSESRFREFIDYWVTGDDCYTKHLSQLPTDRDFVKGILDGWAYGDGCQTKNSSIISGQTSSEKLAYQLQTLAVGLGLPSHMRTYFTSSDNFLEVKTGETKQRWELKLTPQYHMCFKNNCNILSKKTTGVHHKLQSKVCDNYVERKITDISTEEYSGNVYDLTIDGLPYFLCEGVIIHNSIFEEVFERDEKNQLVKIRKLAPRLQRTVKKWLIDEKGGLAGIEQQAYFATKDSNIWKTTKIPVDKLVVFTYRQEGSNFEGDGGMLRPAYKHWFIKDKLYLIQAIGLERHALGIPVIFLPKGATTDDKNYAKHVVKTWRAHEEAGMLFPEGVKVDTIEGKFQNQALEEAIKHHDMEIGKSVLAQFMQLGTGTTGSWALSKDQSDLFLMSLNSVVKNLSDPMNRYVIRPWIEMNFGKREKYHELTCENITKTSNQETITALQSLMTMGLVEKDDDLSEWAREKWAIPAKKDPTPEELAIQQQQQQQQPGDAQGQPGVANAKDAGGNAGDIQAGPPGPGSIGAGGDGSAEMSEKFKTYWDMKTSNAAKTSTVVKLSEKPETNIAKLLIRDALSKVYDDSINQGCDKIRANAKKNGITDAQAGSVLDLIVRPMFKEKKDYVVNHFGGAVSDTIKQMQHTAPQYKQAQAQMVSRLCDMPVNVLSMVGEGLNILQSFGGRDDYDSRDEDDDDNEDKHRGIERMFDGLHKEEGKKVSPVNNAPTFRDARTGKLKYAKNAVVDGQHVGGQWAHTLSKVGEIGGMGVSVGGLSLILLQRFAASLGTEIKNQFLEGAKKAIVKTVHTNSVARTLMLDIWDLSLDDKKVQKNVGAGKKKTVTYTEERIGRNNALFKIKDMLMEGIGDQKKLSKSKQISGGGITARLNSYGISAPKDIGAGIEKVSDIWSHDLMCDLTMPNLDPTTGFRLHGGTLVNDRFRATTLGEILKGTNPPHPLWEIDEIPSNAHPGMTLEDYLGLPPSDPDNFNRSGMPLMTPEQVSKNALNAPIPFAKLVGSSEREPQHSIKFKSQWGLGNTQDIGTTIGEHYNLTPDLAKDRVAAGVVLGEGSTGDLGSAAEMNGWQRAPGGVHGTFLAMFALGTAAYIFSKMWRNVTKNGIDHVKVAATGLTSGAMDQKQLQQYNDKLQQQRRDASPTGGRPGRPITKAPIPEHLKRAPGRPPAKDDPKEIERKRNIDDIVKRWEQDRRGGGA